MRKLHVAVAGLGFGAEFVPIYMDHPHVRAVSMSDLDAGRLARCAERYPDVRAVTTVEELIANPDIDAIHLVTDIPNHARQAVAALEAGKHCACAVPAATSLDDLHRLVAAERASGRRYMMMETAVYTRQCLFALDMQARGEFGHIQLMRGAHYQDLEGLPPYWAGMPPMWYSTHAVGPLFAISGSYPTRVRCLGAGRMREELTRQYGNPWPAETALFETDQPGLVAEVTRTLFHCARAYIESFTIYGENACYEWQMEGQPPVLFSSSPVVPGQPREETCEVPEPPDRADLLPEPLRMYTRRFTYTDEKRGISFVKGGGHHGSHPHLVHEFVSAIVEDRHARVDAVTAAQWTAAGICAHSSAMSGGDAVEVPSFR